MKNLIIPFVMVFTLLIGCTESVSKNESARILAMGDSLLAAHQSSGRAISDIVEDALNEQVIDRSVIGARMIYNLPISGSLGLNISKQYREANWDWVILNGGGNDLWLGCGCAKCDRKLDKLVTTDGKAGEITRIVTDIRKTGAQVIYVGYLRSPGVGSPIESCRDDGDALEGRIANMAKQDQGVYFVSLADLVPYGDRSYHGADMIHPSIKASREIGHRVASVIAVN